MANFNIWSVKIRKALKIDRSRYLLNRRVEVVNVKTVNMSLKNFPLFTHDWLLDIAKHFKVYSKSKSSCYFSLSICYYLVL